MTTAESPTAGPAFDDGDDAKPAPSPGRHADPQKLVDPERPASYQLALYGLHWLCLNGDEWQTGDAVAEATGLSVGTAKAQLRDAARAKVIRRRAVIEEEGDDRPVIYFAWPRG